MFASTAQHILHELRLVRVEVSGGTPRTVPALDLVSSGEPSAISRREAVMSRCLDVSCLGSGLAIGYVARLVLTSAQDRGASDRDFPNTGKGSCLVCLVCLAHIHLHKVERQVKPSQVRSGAPAHTRQTRFDARTGHPTSSASFATAHIQPHLQSTLPVAPSCPAQSTL